MKASPKVSIELDKPRTLWLNFNAMALFEKETGKHAFKALGDPSASDLRALVWACLVHEDKELTLDMVGETMDLTTVEYVMGKIMEAWQVALPDKKGKKAGNLPSGTG